MLSIPFKHHQENTWLACRKSEEACSKQLGEEISTYIIFGLHAAENTKGRIFVQFNSLLHVSFLTFYFSHVRKPNKKHVPSSNDTVILTFLVLLRQRGRQISWNLFLLSHSGI